MKKICFLILAALISTVSMAQTAKSVLDKAAANITVKEGVKANFRMTGDVSNPTEAQLQTINPYNFINLYKNGYTSTLNTTGNAYVVHLTSTAKDKKIKELFVTIDKKSYHPTQVKLLQGKSWTIFDISDLSKSKIADSQFRFNAKDFPQAEVIDLR